MADDNIAGNGRKSRFNPYGASNGSKIRTTGRDGPQKDTRTSTVSVEGWKRTNCKPSDVADFIRNNAQPSVSIIDATVSGNSLLLTLSSPEEASAVKRLNSIHFKGGILSVRFYRTDKDSGSISQMDIGSLNAAGSVIEKLSSFIQSRYNKELKMLDLDHVDSDPMVTQLKLKVFDHSAPKSKLGPVLCKVIQDQCPDVETISLSGNKLRSLEPFSTLPTRVPNLVNLSLQDNLLFSYKDVEPLNGKDFAKLREVVFIGNKFREFQLSKPGGDIIYKSNVKKLFPTIQILDMEPVLDEIHFGGVVGEALAAELPLKTQNGFMDPKIEATAQQFLASFYPLFDTNRAALYHYYDDKAIFSLQVNSIRVTGGSVKSGTFYDRSSGSGRYSNQGDRSFEDWFPFNRNLSKVKQPGNSGLS